MSTWAVVVTALIVMAAALVVDASSSGSGGGNQSLEAVQWKLLLLDDDHRSCRTDEDCVKVIQGSKCRLHTLQCGRCTCPPGFAQFIPSDSSPVSCRRAVGLGQACSPPGHDSRKPAAICRPDGNTECSRLLQRCVCRRGFTRSPLDVTKCVAISQARSKLASELCLSSARCSNSLECINFECGCRIGYITLPSTCRPRKLLDSCQRDSDCSLVKFAQCLNSTCQCRQDFATIRFMDARGKENLACFNPGQGDRLRRKSQTCSLERREFCKFPLGCRSCTPKSTSKPHCVNLTEVALINRHRMAGSQNSSYRPATPPTFSSLFFLEFVSFLIVIRLIILPSR